MLTQCPTYVNARSHIREPALPKYKGTPKMVCGDKRCHEPSNVVGEEYRFVRLLRKAYHQPEQMGKTYARLADLKAFGVALES